MTTHSALDSLDVLELLVHLEKCGFEIRDAEFGRLQPYLVPSYTLQWRLGSLLVSVEVIAQQGCHVLAIHNSGNVLVGDLEPGAQRGKGTRYRSLNLACLNFISLVESSANQ